MTFVRSQWRPDPQTLVFDLEEDVRAKNALLELCLAQFCADAALPFPMPTLPESPPSFTLASGT